MTPTKFLTIEQQLTLLGELVTIFDHAERFATGLRDRGFDAWVPFLDAMKASGASPEEIECSLLVKNERAKQQFAWPGDSWHRPLHPDLVATQSFRSPILQRLENERRLQLERENPQTPYEKLPLSARDLDPILRRSYISAEENHRKGQRDYRQQEQAAQTFARHRERRRDEVSRISTDVSAHFEWTEKGCRDFCAEIMLRDGGALGFKFDSKRSTETSTFFTKNLSDSWDLCFFGSITLWAPERTYMDLKLAVVPAAARERPTVHDNGDFMFLQYELVAPFFKAAYWPSDSLRELEVVLKAWIALYDEVRPFIEGYLINRLPVS